MNPNEACTLDHHTLAAGQRDDLAEKFKNFLEKSMTLDELAEAQRLAREWKAKGK